VVGHCERETGECVTRVATVLLVLAVAACTAGDDAPTAERSARTRQGSAPPATSVLDVDGVDGAPSLDDPYFAGLGNGGYDVSHYELAIDVDTERNVIDADASITARAGVDLASFSLDLRSLEVTAVEVDGIPAEFAHEGAELIITPRAAIGNGAGFVVDVEYRGQPTASADSPLGDTGWQSSGNVTWVMGQPNGASTWFPANDHPSDKATYQVEVTAPETLTAVSNGTLRSSVPDGSGRRAWVWEMEQPMATYLATVVIDEFELTSGSPVAGTAIRDAVPVTQVGSPELDGLADRHAAMLAHFETLFGPYPFDAYGVVVVDEALGLALETQSISMLGTGISSDLYLSHELAHQWFGNSVTPRSWQDIWLNEGFATYAQWRWSDHAGDLPIDQAASTAHTDASASGARIDLRDPGPSRMFDTEIYSRGALALYALGRTVGEDVLVDILREWVGRYRYGNATTDDFIMLAEEVSGEQLDTFFDDWLAAAPPPPLP
jgi:aminopeptidase N